MRREFPTTGRASRPNIASAYSIASTVFPRQIAQPDPDWDFRSCARCCSKLLAPFPWRTEWRVAVSPLRSALQPASVVVGDQAAPPVRRRGLAIPAAIKHVSPDWMNATTKWLKRRGMPSMTSPLPEYTQRSCLKADEMALQSVAKRSLTTRADARARATPTPATQASHPKRSNNWPSTALPTRPPRK